MKNALNTLTFEGRTVRVAKTGYTGEPLGYEVYIESAEAPGCGTGWWSWAPNPLAWAPGIPCAWRLTASVRP